MYERTLERWALERAQFCNASFKTDGVPWLPDDFLGKGNRSEREKKHKAERLMGRLADLQLNTAMKPGQPEPDFIPAWASKSFDMTGSLSEKSLGR